MREAKEKFDAIYIDFPDPMNYDLSKLYSREFYSFINKSLKDDGFAVLDAPGTATFSKAEKSKRNASMRFLDIYISTLDAAGFKEIIPYTTNLETDNKNAEKLLDKVLGDISGMVMIDSDVNRKNVKRIMGKELMIRQIVENFVDSYCQGFIIVKKKKETNDYKFRNMGAKLLVLNEKRFHLSLDLSYKGRKKGDKINSIMRPVLPESSSKWYVRVPY